MSWKLYLIIISNAAKVTTSELPSKIGLDSLKATKETTILQAQRSESISIGKYKDNIIIVSQDLVFTFYDLTPSDLEKKLTAVFPNSEIAILTLNGTVDLYGYNIISNGVRQRVKHGADLSVYADIGQKLPEEIQISKEQLFDKEEFKEMKAELSKKELQELIDQEISLRTVFRLTKRYFGKELDQMDNLDTIVLTQYE